jgi:hypothetical protein
MAFCCCTTIAACCATNAACCATKSAWCRRPPEATKARRSATALFSLARSTRYFLMMAFACFIVFGMAAIHGDERHCTRTRLCTTLVCHLCKYGYRQYRKRSGCAILMPCSGNSNRVTIPHQPIKGTRPVWDNLFDRVVVRSLHRVVKGGQNVLSGEKTV